MTKKSKKKALKNGSKDKIDERLMKYEISSNKPEETYTDDEASEFMGKLSVFEDSISISNTQKKRMLKEQLITSHIAYHKLNSTRTNYPIDLWFLISLHIMPEQIQTFACICSDTYRVTRSKQFWLNFYTRFVTDSSNALPSHLKANSISTNIGLKVRVIRSLFYDYEPMRSSIQQLTPILQTPSNVELKMCRSFWWKPAKSLKHQLKIFVFHFKLSPHGSVEKNIFKVTDLIQFNCEENFSILRVVSPSYVHLPNACGLCLTSVNISVSSDMRYHKLKLLFHPYRAKSKYVSSQASLVINIEPVFDVHVLDWWHPEYPHPFDY